MDDPKATIPTVVAGYPGLILDYYKFLCLPIVIKTTSQHRTNHMTSLPEMVPCLEYYSFLIAFIFYDFSFNFISFLFRTNLTFLVFLVFVCFLVVYF